MVRLTMKSASSFCSFMNLFTFHYGQINYLSIENKENKLIGFTFHYGQINYEEFGSSFNNAFGIYIPLWLD